MKYFMRTASICQIIFLEMIGIACTSSVIANILGMFMLFGCESIGKVDAYLIISILLGAFCLYIVFRDIFIPHYSKASFRPVLKMNRLMIPNPFLGESQYEFPSTHPSYIFADLAAILFGAFFYWVGNNKPSVAGCAFEYNYLFGHFMLAIPLLFPVIRLAWWYIFKKKLPEAQCKKAWVPLAYFWGIVLGALLLILILSKLSWQ